MSCSTPTALSEDGTAALNDTSISDDGEWLAYAVSRSGSDWQIWHIRNVTTGEDLPETLEWSKFSGAAWAHDGSGFYYCRYPAPAEGTTYQEANYNQKLYFHRLNTPQSADTLVYERPDQPEWGFGAEVSDDGRYLVLGVWQGTDTRNRFFYQALHAGSQDGRADPRPWRLPTISSAMMAPCSTSARTWIAPARGSSPST